MLHKIRQLSIILLPLLLIAAWVINHLKPEGANGLFEGLFIILLTANIGYFTNFIAIKMLFKPYQKSALGRQGLIPKNQPKLAKALASTLSDHFLANEHWQEYLAQANIIPNTLNAAAKHSEEWLKKPANQTHLQKVLSCFLTENQAPINAALGQVQSTLIESFNQNFDAGQMLKQGFDWIDKQFQQNPKQMEFMIEPLVNTIAANIPAIASRLADVVDEHIEKQDTIRRGVAKAAKWSANFSEDDIKNYLFRMVASPEFRQTLFEGIETLVSEYKSFASKKQSNSLDIEAVIKDFMQQNITRFNFSGSLHSAIAKPQAGKNIAQFLIHISPTVFQQLEQLLLEPKVNNAINQHIAQLIESIDLREVIEEKAANFSPKTMENIFHNMIADQLVFIELLGALLGALSGLALVNIHWFIGLTATALAYLGVDIFLSHRSQKEIKNQV